MEDSHNILPEFRLPKPKINRHGMLLFRHNRNPSMPVGDEEIIENEQQSILCVNCLDSVSEEAIDMHMWLCKTYISLMTYDGLYNLNISLEKYKVYMQHLQRISEDSIFKSLEIQAEKLLVTSSQPSVEEVYQETQDVFNEYSGTVHKKLCIDRLLEFAKQKALLVGISEHRAKKIKNFKKGIQRFSSLKHIPKTRATETYSIGKNLIDDLQSQLNTQIESERCSLYFTLSNQSNLLGTLPNASTDDGNKQEFYAKCLLAKHDFPSSHPVQSIPIHLLYQKATEKNLSPEKWDLFISQEFSSVEIDKKQQFKQYSETTKHTQIESIDEMDEN